MAVVDVYTDALNTGQPFKLTKPLYGGAAQNWRGWATFVTGATDSNGSKYRLFRELPANLVILGMNIFNDATSGTSWKFGFYLCDSGAIIGTGDQLDSAIDLTTGHTTASNPLKGLSAITHNLMYKSIMDIVGDTVAPTSTPNSVPGQRKKGYDFVATGTTLVVNKNITVELLGLIT